MANLTFVAFSAAVSAAYGAGRNVALGRVDA